MTVERCHKCKSVYWVGLTHGCVNDEVHPILKQSFELRKFKDSYIVRAPIEIRARVRQVE